MLLKRNLTVFEESSHIENFATHTGHQKHVSVDLHLLCHCTSRLDTQITSVIQSASQKILVFSQSQKPSPTPQAFLQIVIYSIYYHQYLFVGHFCEYTNHYLKKSVTGVRFLLLLHFQSKLLHYFTVFELWAFSTFKSLGESV